MSERKSVGSQTTNTPVSMTNPTTNKPATKQAARRPLAYPSDLCFAYDGSLAGFYCCVHESVYEKQLPLDICADGEVQPSLLIEKWIPTDAKKAVKVRKAIAEKIGIRARELIETVFLTHMEHKELCMLRFLLDGFVQGPVAMERIAEPELAALLAAERHFGGERHLLLGFIRFSDFEGKLVATIKPKNFVLPALREHFTMRYANEDFMIYDRTHKAALLYEQRRSHIYAMEELPAFEASPEEERYRALWKEFYNTLSIKERYNPICRRTHMPMRYWSEMTEMKEWLGRE